MEKNDPSATFNIGCYYEKGMYEFPQDTAKALELWHRAGELGDAKAYSDIGYTYYNGDGVTVDKKKAVHYFELAAIRGDSLARCNLGIKEEDAGNMNRALKHYMIAVRSGSSKSLEIIKELYSDGHATKEDYAKALSLYQTYLSEIKSVHRDEAAAAREDYRYY